MKPLLVVDGYNVIGAWKEAEKQQWPLDACRDKLLHLLQDLSGYTGENVVLVFDGYQSDRKFRTEETQAGVTLVFTMHGETADSYIERYVAQLPKYQVVRVATSDGLEQSQVLSTGATRLTARELLREAQETRRRGLAAHQTNASLKRNPLMERLSQEQYAALEKLRRSK